MLFSLYEKMHESPEEILCQIFAETKTTSSHDKIGCSRTRK